MFNADSENLGKNVIHLAALVFTDMHPRLRSAQVSFTSVADAAAFWWVVVADRTTTNITQTSLRRPEGK